MILEFIKSLLGSWGRALLDFLQMNPEISTLIFSLWLAIWLAGKYQLQRIEKRTGTFVLENSQQALDENPRMTVKQLYALLYPKWCQMLRTTAWFVPHRWELWPLPATPKIVQERINFTPKWLKQYLKENGISFRSHR
ncbi:MAG: hypothetical protein GTO14_25945 [Anaerolineales bacterium]|nr:hypothetical protein [Anaerolineales bacterium]